MSGLLILLASLAFGDAAGVQRQPDRLVTPAAKTDSAKLAFVNAQLADLSAMPSDIQCIGGANCPNVAAKVLDHPTVTGIDHATLPDGVHWHVTLYGEGKVGFWDVYFVTRGDRRVGEARLWKTGISL